VKETPREDDREGVALEREPVVGDTLAKDVGFDVGAPRLSNLRQRRRDDHDWEDEPVLDALTAELLP